jgi:Carboxypeptidase regulatory-like domain
MRWLVSSAATILILASAFVDPDIGAQGQRPRDPSRGGAADGAIAGQVVDADTGQPVRWATISITQTSRRFQTTVSTGPDGNYRIDDLTPGPYILTIRKGGFVPQSYGARRQTDPPTPVSVAVGTTATADVRLTRGGAIAGRVLTASGDPVQDVGLQALRIGYDAAGRRTIPTGQPARSDDLGRFRLHSLPRGMYLVEAFRASRPVGPPADRQEEVQRLKPFRDTYYPGTTRLDQAQYVQVEKNQTTPIEFSISASEGATLMLDVLDSTGERPATTGAMLRYAGGPIFGGIPMGQWRSTFGLTNVPDGDHLLVVTARRSDGTLEFATRSITMAGQRVTESVRTAPGITLAATVEVDGDDRTRPPGLAVAAISTAFPGLTADPNQRGTPARVDPDGRVVFTNLFGQRLFRVDAQADWALKAVLLDDADVTDTAVDFRGSRDARPLRIVVTNRTGAIVGTVLNAGEDDEGTRVVAFASDERQWTYESRFTRVAFVKAGGHFELRGLLPGRYLLAHASDLEPGAWGDAEVLRQLRPNAHAVEVVEGQRITVDVRNARTR